MRQSEAVKTPGRNEPCWCGSDKKYKKCHMAMDQKEPNPSGAVRPVAPAVKKSVENPRRAALIKTPEQIAGIREASKLARATLEMLSDRIKAGISTEQINTWVHEFTLDHGAIPAPLNYGSHSPFPKSVCTSVNEVVCHGIPGNRVLNDGDIINVDVTPILNGYYGDTSWMYLVGDVAPEVKKLVEVTKDCLDLGIAQVRPGGHIGDIGHAIQTHAEGLGYSVVREFVGHGTGVRFHEDPQVPHFGRPGHGPEIKAGMVFTIEPMINMGDWRVKVLADDWTAITRDGSLSAQWEHTVLVTKDGVDVLTG